MKFFLLSTCDVWKSCNSMRPYYFTNSSKAGMNRLLSVILKGIQEGDFAYEGDDLEKSEQMALCAGMPNKVYLPCMPTCNQN